jgi:hypothetical protein
MCQALRATGRQRHLRLEDPGARPGRSTSPLPARVPEAPGLRHPRDAIAPNAGLAQCHGAERHVRATREPRAARVSGARPVDIPLPTRDATSAPARCDLPTPGPGRHRRTPRTRVTRAGARATARSAEVMRDTAGAVSRAANVGRHPHADRGVRGAPGVEVCGDSGRREDPRDVVAAKGCRPTGVSG